LASSLCESGIIGRDTSAAFNLQEVGGILFQSLEGIQIVVVSLMAIRGGPHRNRQCSSVSRV
jgi:hypothetical protein